MAFFSWIFLTAATAVAILVGRWLASNSSKRLSFDKAVLAMSIFGVVLVFIGSLLSLASYGGLSVLAVFALIVSSVITFVVTTVIAWVVLMPWSDRLRDRLNSQLNNMSGSNQPPPPMPPYPHGGGQVPPRPNNPPNNWPGNPS